MKENNQAQTTFLWLRQMGLSSLVTDVVHVGKSLHREKER